MTTILTIGGFCKDIDRRYADMEILIREFNENAADGTESWDGYPQRAKLAIHRLNAIHNKYGNLILYRDMLYVLSVFMCTGSLWSRTRWSSRRQTDAENACVFAHWMNIGRLMNLQVDAPELSWKNIEDVVKFKYDYEAKYMRFSVTNKAVVDSTLAYFLNSLPSVIQWMVRPLLPHVLAALQERPEQAAALGLPSPPSSFIRCAVDFALTLRAVISRYLCPPYSTEWVDRLTSKNAMQDLSCPFKVYTPTRNLDFGNTTYTPKGPGYSIEMLGPSSVEPGLTSETPKYTGSYSYS